VTKLEFHALGFVKGLVVTVNNDLAIVTDVREDRVTIERLGWFSSTAWRVKVAVNRVWRLAVEWIRSIR